MHAGSHVCHVMRMSRNTLGPCLTVGSICAGAAAAAPAAGVHIHDQPQRAPSRGAPAGATAGAAAEQRLLPRNSTLWLRRARAAGGHLCAGVAGRLQLSVHLLNPKQSSFHIYSYSWLANINSRLGSVRGVVIHTACPIQASCCLNFITVLSQDRQI